MWNSPRARDNVVLLTDDREALIEALETSPAEQMSALRAIGEQFGGLDPYPRFGLDPRLGSASQEAVPQHPPPEREAILDEATKEEPQGCGALPGPGAVGSFGLDPAAGRSMQPLLTVTASHVTEDFRLRRMA